MLKLGLSNNKYLIQVNASWFISIHYWLCSFWLGQKKNKLGDNKKTIGDRFEGNVFYLNYINYKLYYLNYLKLQR